VARDPLRAVQAMRHRLVEQARYALAACLKSEADVMARIKAIDDAHAQDRAAQQAVENAYQFHEVFRRREQARQTERSLAEAALAAAQARSAEARAGVGTAWAAAEAVELFISERAVAADIEAARREQHELDDIVRCRSGSGLRLIPGGGR
jgi:hypothetical protein